MTTQDLYEKICSEKYENEPYFVISDEFNLEYGHYCRYTECGRGLELFSAFICEDGYVVWCDEVFEAKGYNGLKLNLNSFDLLEQFVLEIDIIYECGNYSVRIYNFDQLEELDEWIKKHNRRIYSYRKENDLEDYEYKIFESKEFFSGDELKEEISKIKTDYEEWDLDLEYEYSQVPH